MCACGVHASMRTCIFDVVCVRACMRVYVWYAYVHACVWRVHVFITVPSLNKYIHVPCLPSPSSYPPSSSPSSSPHPSSHSQGLQQKEKDDINSKMKLQHEQSVLLSRLAELGASHVKCLLSVKTHDTLPPVSSPSPSPSSYYSSESTASAPVLSGQVFEVKGQRSLSLSDDLEGHDDENMVIDVLTHESDDEASSTTSGSDGGCTATTHKIQIAV